MLRDQENSAKPSVISQIKLLCQVAKISWRTESDPSVCSEKVAHSGNFVNHSGISPESGRETVASQIHSREIVAYWSQTIKLALGFLDRSSVITTIQSVRGSDVITGSSIRCDIFCPSNKSSAKFVGRFGFAALIGILFQIGLDHMPAFAGQRNKILLVSAR